MRDFLNEIFENQPIDPVESARRAQRVTLRNRFYREVAVAEAEGGVALQLDGRAVRTPARRLLAAPVRDLAEAIAAEWRAQREHIDPATMPLTRLANSIIDGVSDAVDPVADEIGRYLGSDLLFYRASEPPGLVAKQAAAWDPVLDWAHTALGARFVLGQDLMFAPQPEAALAAARAAIPREPWLLGALHVVTTLTGSALLALALLHGRLSADEVWAAAHVDEDWNMAQWGRDDLALDRRASRLAEMQAAHQVLAVLRGGASRP
jgi:chaperone required for assembly of F1-ATPase